MTRAIIALCGGVFLIGVTSGWLLARGPTPVVLPPVAPAVDASAARADTLAREVGRLGGALDSLADSLKRLSVPRPTAPLPAKPGGLSHEAEVYIDTLQQRLASSAVDNDALRTQLGGLAARLASEADSAHAASARLAALGDTLRAVRDRVVEVEHERDRFARLARAPRTWRVGVGVDAGLAGEGFASVAGVVVEAHRAVLFTTVDLSLLGGYGLGGNWKTQDVTPGPGGAVRVAVTF